MTTRLVRATGLDMHFRLAKIKVATSVCTGGRNCPPDSSAAMGSNPACRKDLIEDYHRGNLRLNGASCVIGFKQKVSNTNGFCGQQTVHFQF